MAKGKIKRVANLDRKFGANEEYLFFKVQADFSSRAEEYLLLTDNEFVVAATRGTENPEDCTGLTRGVLYLRDNKDRRFGSADHYYAVRVITTAGESADLLLTDAGLERIRQRVESNAEDIEANRESWLADLFD